MAHQITSECVACGTCISECPVEAISEGDPIYKIDPDKCTDCGACAAVCPSEAIIEGK
jgi:ferredoxin